MSHHPFRTISHEQLAALLRSDDHSPIELEGQGRVRYVYFEPNKRRTFVIRENELPGKYIRQFEGR